MHLRRPRAVVTLLIITGGLMLPFGRAGNSKHTTGPQGPAAKPVTPADFAETC